MLNDIYRFWATYAAIQTVYFRKGLTYYRKTRSVCVLYSVTTEWESLNDKMLCLQKEKISRKVAVTKCCKTYSDYEIWYDYDDSKHLFFKIRWLPQYYFHFLWPFLLYTVLAIIQHLQPLHTISFITYFIQKWNLLYSFFNCLHTFFLHSVFFSKHYTQIN